MNKKQKLVLVTGLILILATLIVWLTSGAEVFTKTQVFVDTTSDIDKMLGIENTELQDKFIFGLVPPGLTATAEMVSASTVAGLVVVISGILFFLFRIKKQKETI